MTTDSDFIFKRRLSSDEMVTKYGIAKKESTITQTPERSSCMYTPTDPAEVQVQKLASQRVAGDPRISLQRARSEIRRELRREARRASVATKQAAPPPRSLLDESLVQRLAAERMQTTGESVQKARTEIRRKLLRA